MADSELTFDLSDPEVAHGSASGVDPGLLEGNALALVGRGALAGLRDFGSSLWNFIKVPGDVVAGKYSPEEIKELAPGYALGLAGMGTPAGVAMVPENALGIFGGTKSLTAPKVKLWGAQTLEKMGVERDPIYEKTGWFRGSDGKWRYTVSDEGANIVGDWTSNQTLSNVLQHPEFYKAYPQFQNWTVSKTPEGALYSGRLNYPRKTIEFNPENVESIYGGNVLSPLLHELQHGVQGAEGFVAGGAPSMFLPKDYSFAEYKKAHQNYLRLGGEVEARAVQEQLARQDWRTPIWEHEGYIPFEEQIQTAPLPSKYFSQLVPVDHDPFASGSSLTPVEYDPFDLSAYVRR